LSEEEVAALRAVVMETRGTVIPHIDVAMTRKSIVWPIKMESPCVATLLPHLNGERGLARLLCAHALLHHHEGNDAEALRDVRRVLFISRASERQPFIVSHLVAVGIATLATDVVEDIAPDLKVGDAPGAATAKQVKELIAELLDDAPSRTGMRDALLGERMSHLDTANCLIDGKLTMESMFKLWGRKPAEAAAVVISRETAEADGVLLMRHSTALIRAFDASRNWPDYKTRDPGRPREFPVADMKKHPLATMLFPATERATEAHFRGATARRLAAVTLAVRTHAAAHADKLPDTLEALVPDLLPSVPDDPMAMAQPLQYLPDADRPIVYSVGVNGRDDAGSEGGDPKLGRWQQNDAVMHLSRAGADAGGTAAKTDKQP
jgi:hypothetical protein